MTKHIANADPSRKRIPRKWKIVAGCVVLTAFFVPVPVGGPAFSRVFDLAHVLVFGFLAFVFTRALPVTSLWRRVFVAFSLAFAAGIAVELIQPWFGRKRSHQDVVYNCIGASVGILIALIVRAIVHSRTKR